jgi:Icc-related predicted phosphoesterase
MRLVILSDTHGRNPDVRTLPDGDVLIHCGDFTNFGEEDELSRFRAWLREIPHEHKIVIPGNHDLCFDAPGGRGALDALGDIVGLIHETTVIDGVKFFGSPYTPKFFDWAFMYEPRESQRRWLSIPDDTDVVITHGPAFNRLDQTSSGKNAGCVALGNRLGEVNSTPGRVRPLLHCHGHIHEASGELHRDGWLTINAAQRVCVVDL